MKLSCLSVAVLVSSVVQAALPSHAAAQTPPAPPPTAAPPPPTAPPPLSVPGQPGAAPGPAPLPSAPPPATAPPPYPPPPGGQPPPPSYYSPPPPAGSPPGSGPPPGSAPPPPGTPPAAAAPPGYPPPPPGYSYYPAQPAYYTPPPSTEARVKPNARFHNGFYMRFGFGVTSGSGSIETPSTTTNMKGETVNTGETAHAKLSGPGVAFDMAFGATVFRGLAIAGNISVRTLGTPDVKFEKGQTQSGRYTGFSVTNIGIMADWYTDPRKGLHIQGGVGVAQVSHTANSPRVTSSTASEDARYSGLGLHLGVGYETFISEEWGIGGLLRIDTASVTSDGSSSVTAQNTSISIFAPSLVFTGTYN